MPTTGCHGDDLVRLLNEKGYQPVILPRTNVQPPEIYTYADQRLIRRGPLSDYLPDGVSIPPVCKGKLADIQYKESSRKNLGSAASFLGDALKCIGVTSTPKIDLSFVKGCQLTFSFADVTYQAVDASQIDHLLSKGLKTGAIPQEDIVIGCLHIAYEYAYAKSLMMRIVKTAKFRADLKAVKIEQFIDLGVQGRVEAESETTIKFKAAIGSPTAFAFKVGRLERRGKQWAFFPEEIMGKGFVAEEKKIPYLIERGAVLRVEVG